MALSLISCSDDDSNGPVNNKDLDEVTTFINDQKVELNKFENNRLTERYLYDPNGDVFFDDQYTYDGQGRVLTRTIVTGDQTHVQDFQYDAEGRLELVTSESLVLDTETAYDYSQPGKVVVTQTYFNTEGGDSIYKSTYDLDQQGRVYKITDGEPGNINYTFQAVYEGNNITQITDTNYNGPEGQTVVTTTNFIFDTEIPVKGEYLKIRRNQFGGNALNAILFYGTFSLQNDNYVVYSSNGEVNATVAHEFDNDGFPEKILHFSDIENRVIEITYQ